MTIEWWLTYLLTTTILSLSPGSGAINTMSTGISHGYRGAVASISGLPVGLALHIARVGIGLGALFSQSLLAFEILKWARLTSTLCRKPCRVVACSSGR